MFVVLQHLVQRVICTTMTVSLFHSLSLSLSILATYRFLPSLFFSACAKYLFFVVAFVHSDWMIQFFFFYFIHVSELQNKLAFIVARLPAICYEPSFASFVLHFVPFLVSQAMCNGEHCLCSLSLPCCCHWWFRVCYFVLFLLLLLFPLLCFWWQCIMFTRHNTLTFPAP